MAEPDPLLADLRVLAARRGGGPRSRLRAWMEDRWEGLEPLVRGALAEGAAPWGAWAGAWAKAGLMPKARVEAWGAGGRDTAWGRREREKAGRAAKATYYRVRRDRLAAAGGDGAKGAAMAPGQRPRVVVADRPVAAPAPGRPRVEPVAKAEVVGGGGDAEAVLAGLGEALMRERRGGR